MLTQTIIKYKPPAVYTPPVNQRTYFPQQHQPGMVKVMDKLEYAQFLASLKIKAGDWIVYHASAKPYTVWQVYLCTYIEEIHHNVKNWGSVGSGPWCGMYRGYVSPAALVTARAPDGLGEFRSFAPQHYLRIDEADVPIDLRKMYARTDDHQVPPTP